MWPGRSLSATVVRSTEYTHERGLACQDPRFSISNITENKLNFVGISAFCTELLQFSENVIENSIFRTKNLKISKICVQTYFEQEAVLTARTPLILSIAKDNQLIVAS